MIGKKTSVKKMFFWLTAGMVLSMTAIILVSFFLTKNIAVMGWAGINSLRCTMDAFYGTTVGNETVKFYF